MQQRGYGASHHALDVAQLITLLEKALEEDFTGLHEERAASLPRRLASPHSSQPSSHSECPMSVAFKLIGGGGFSGGLFCITLYDDRTSGPLATYLKPIAIPSRCHSSNSAGGTIRTTGMWRLLGRRYCEVHTSSHESMAQLLLLIVRLYARLS